MKNFVKLNSPKGKKGKHWDIGVFPMAADLLHAGHVTALKQARAQCDHLIVLLNCNPAKHNDKKTPPTQSIFERYLQLQSVKWVDEVIPYECEKDLIIALGCIDYNIRFLGSDYKDKEWTGKEIEEKRGIKPFFLPREYHGLSSTDLRNRVGR